jgi:hypothetical protein
LLSLAFFAWAHFWRELALCSSRVACWCILALSLAPCLSSFSPACVRQWHRMLAPSLADRQNHNNAEASGAPE